MIKKYFLTALAVAFTVNLSTVRADEGMWMLPLIEKLNIKDMKAKGFKLSAKDIYDTNGLAIKDAVLIFGGGCTGGVISKNGLVITNHHCGYGAIQQHSSIEHDYLKNGFWAMSTAEELPTPGLSVTFIRQITDVTDRIVPSLRDDMSEDVRSETISNLSDIIAKEALVWGSSKKAAVESFFGGNQYFLVIFETYNDIRMVGAPPSSIGKFGGETDNWMWPRHTGDFSLFRIYASPDGTPANYSENNVPYDAPKHLPVSLKGIKEEDFAMIIGFPGSTDRYMSSFEVDYLVRHENPIRILIRGERQDLMKEDMLADDKVRIQYADKYVISSNYWKNSIGKNLSLKKLNVKEEKEKQEEQFMRWVTADTARMRKYGNAIRLIEDAVKGAAPYKILGQYLTEGMSRGIEIIKPVNILSKLIDKNESDIDSSRLKEVKNELTDFYKNYSEPTDRKITKRMLAIISDSIDKRYLPPVFIIIEEQYNGDINAFVDDMYDHSILADTLKVSQFLAEPNAAALLSDPAFKMTRGIVQKYNWLVGEVDKFDTAFVRGHRLFIEGLMEMYPDKTFYPDANFTMRMTFGQVLSYEPRDAVRYNYFTTLTGVMEKEDPANAFEFAVPEKLKELYRRQDFKPYSTKDYMPVNFITDNDITGGNSGSPVINARGELIGLAFDGNWEAMSGDIIFEQDMQRCISVDIRYVLFIIDKFAGATHLLDEITIVK